MRPPFPNKAAAAVQRAARLHAKFPRSQGRVRGIARTVCRRGREGRNVKMRTVRDCRRSGVCRGVAHEVEVLAARDVEMPAAARQRACRDLPIAAVGEIDRAAVGDVHVAVVIAVGRQAAGGRGGRPGAAAFLSVKDVGFGDAKAAHSGEGLFDVLRVSRKWIHDTHKD